MPDRRKKNIDSLRRNTSYEEFAQAIRNAGIEPPAKIITDGRLHRFNISGDKPGSKNGWYVFHDGYPAGAFGCWKRGVSETWSSREYQSLTAEEKANYAAHMEAIRKQRDEEQARVHAVCRKASKELWDKGRAFDPNHPYILAKGIKPAGIKQLSNTLMIPVRDYAGTLHGLQFVYPDGSKCFKIGTLKAGNFCWIPGDKTGPVLICEGYATGVTVNEATGHSVAVAFDAGNLGQVAQKLRKKMPDRALVVCADDDQWEDSNPGLTKATAAAREAGALLAMPSFQDTTTKPTDFNDLYNLEGLDAVGRYIQAAAAPLPKAEEDLPGLIRLETVKPEPVEWLWNRYIALGKINLLDGDPGLGKSLCTLDLAARCSIGKKMPDETDAIQCGTIIMTLEDGLADTIVPRIEVAGGDKTKIRVLQGVPDSSGNLRIPTVEDVDYIARACKSANAKFVVMDPLTGYLGSTTNSWKDQDIRGALSPLVRMAEEEKIAVLAVRHLNKSSSSQSLYRGGGSIGFIGLARVGLLIAKDPEDENRRILAGVKSNLAPLPASLSYAIEDCRGIPRIVWGGVTIHTADSLLALPSTPEERTAIDEAKDFILDILASGPVQANEIIREAKKAGIAEKTLHRAKKLLSVVSKKGLFKEGWKWSLPHEDGQAISNMVNINNDRLRSNVAILDEKPEEEEVIEILDVSEAGR